MSPAAKEDTSVLTAGLVSISFRRKTPGQIVSLCERAGLRAIEWGGDVHVPAGDERRAREVLALTRSAGLSVCSYGSYYRLDQPEDGLLRVYDVDDSEDIVDHLMRNGHTVSEITRNRIGLEEYYVELMSKK